MSLAAADLRVLVMAGGTGGHVFPALAVAHCLREQGAHVHWLGACGGMESSLVAQHGFEFHGVAIRGLRGNGALGWLCAPINARYAKRHGYAFFNEVFAHSRLC